MYKSIAAPVTIPKVYGKISDGTDSTLHSIEEGDAIIIGSDDVSKKSAELAAKSAALLTIMNHEKHYTHF